jgi:hypothetical protein
MYKLKTLVVAIALLFSASQLKAQYLMDMIDTTKSSGQDLLGIIKKFNHIRLSGYLQPQFQVAESEGSKSYAGGDFAAGVNNRFMMRRSRVKVDYAAFDAHKMPKVQIAFQFDATERGVVVRDVWGKVFENKYNCFSLVSGVFARPFGFELNFSSSEREAPERGRMSQILMRTERDMGAMLTFAPQKKDHPLHRIKNYPLSKNVSLSVSGSVLHGGIKQANKTIFKVDEKTADFIGITDSTKIGSRAAKTFLGADAQLKIKSHVGLTEFRAEYIRGTQSATSATSETPAALPTDPLYSRPFDGAYFCFLQGFGKKHQIAVKYDWYDPNTHVKSTEIKTGTKLTAADVRFATLGLGYIHYFHESMKIVLWYDIINNEKTLLTGLTTDAKDNIFTCRLHYRF